MDYFRRITFGRYIDTGSVIHRLDPRTKLISLIIFATLIFYRIGADVFGAQVLASLIVFSFFVIVLSKISIKYVTKCIMKFLWFFLFIMIFHSFFTPGRVIPSAAEYGVIVTYEGVSTAGMMALKLYSVIVYTYIFILTTTPLEMTHALKKLLWFLKVFKVPVEDIAIMITLSIKFIPTFFKEMQKIVAAQRARGIIFSEGGIVGRIKAASLIITPIFYNTFKRAEELNSAMISRGYRAGAPRGSYKNIRMRLADYCVIAVAALLLVLV